MKEWQIKAKSWDWAEDNGAGIASAKDQTRQWESRKKVKQTNSFHILECSSSQIICKFHLVWPDTDNDTVHMMDLMGW